MKKLSKFLGIASLSLALFNVLMFFSMRPCWSGISKTLGYENSKSWFVLNLPVFLIVLLALVALANAVLFIAVRNNIKWKIVFTSVNTVFFIAIMVIIAMGAADYMLYIWPNFLDCIVVLSVVLALIALLFYYPKTKLKNNKVFQYTMIGIVILFAVFDLTGFDINSITYEPVVYAVEDEYQIVFSSSSESLGWVEIDGVKYYDLYAGSEKSDTCIHKVCVPMSKLDSAKKYEIHVQKAIYRGPFGGLLGRDIEKEYSFRPVDISDGLSYSEFSDIHCNGDVAVKTASYMSDVDFLVMNGDAVSMVESFEDANYVNELCFKMTGGEIPVIYARGNHEVKGTYSEQLYKFVGSKDGNFYYNFYFDGVYGITLDIGEDHDDDWWEYYGTADYDSYRDEQLELLKEESDKDLSGYQYRLCVCHIPPVYINARRNQVDFKTEATAYLNKMDLDMCLTGHQHEVWVFEPGLIASDPDNKLKYNENYKSGSNSGYLTDFNFPCLMGGKAGYTQSDDNTLTFATSYIGIKVKVDFNSRRQICTFVNSDGEKVHVYNQFYDKDYGDEIEINMDTKEFS